MVEAKDQNLMKNIKVDKITLNIGVGKPGAGLDKAKKLLELITGAKPVETHSKKRIPTWSIRPGLPIACKVTLRGKKAEEVLGRLLKANDNVLSPDKFDKSGNFAFGVKEYIDIPEMKYYADIGVIGLEVAVTLKRAGYRIKLRRIRPAKVGKKHMITKEEAIEFVKERFGTKIGGEE